jgi:phenylalanyl-tRNA synthetase beta chain
MKIPYSWLKDFLKITLAPEAVAARLTMAGVEVGGVEKKDAETIFDIEITSNRPDLLSVCGAARELAAATGTPLVRDCYNDFQKKKLPLCGAVRIEDKKDCALYIGITIRNVSVKSSPAWLAQRIEAAGIRSVNNIVDITNYLLLELGQPMHAFDADKLKGQGVIVRRARSKETLTTIDGNTCALSPENLVIADTQKPVALAGVMGGKDTEVTTSTKNIFLESAWFDPLLTRRSRKKAGIQTESSYRFERGVDRLMVEPAARTCAAMISEVAGGTIASMARQGSVKKNKKTVMLAHETVEKTLGIKIPAAFITRALKALGFSCVKTATHFRCGVPSFRQDVAQAHDLVEEIARLWGYEKFPLTLAPSARVSAEKKPVYETSRHDTFFKRQGISDFLVCLGAREIITYAMVSKSQAGLCGSPEELISIDNPLSADQEVLRPSLVPSMTGAIAWNIKRETEGACFFEQAKIYKVDAGKSPCEEERVCIGIYGRKPVDWKKGKDAQFDFFDLKGIVEALLDTAGLRYALRACASPLFDQSLSLEILDDASRRIGTMGLVCSRVTAAYAIETKEVFVAELSAQALCAHRDARRIVYKNVPKFPSSRRDLSLLVRRDVTHAMIDSTIREAAGALLEQIALFDVYTGTQVPRDMKALSYSLTYRSQEKTLLSDEVETLHAKIVRALEEKLQAKMR